MTEHNERKLTRREFVLLSFGILGLSAQANTLDFLGRLEEAAAWATSDTAHMMLVPAAQYLQGRPVLSSGLTLRRRGGGGSLSGQGVRLQLNDSAFFALSHCDGDATVNEICAALATDLSVPPERVQGDLTALFNCLFRLDLMSFTVACRVDQQYESKDTGARTWETVAT